MRKNFLRLGLHRWVVAVGVLGVLSSAATAGYRPLPPANNESRPAMNTGGFAPAQDAPPRILLAQAADSGGVDFPSRRRSFTEAEFQRLPEYCRYMQGYGYTTPKGLQYQQMIGVALEHVHHYCRGLRDMFFARFASIRTQDRQGLWSRALGEIDYMVRNTPQDNPLMPEFWYQRGEIQLALGDVNEAQKAFENSRKLKPDYWPAYTGWADFLIQNKRFDEAGAVIAQGLQNAPDTPQLLQRRDRLAQPR